MSVKILIREQRKTQEVGYNMCNMFKRNCMSKLNEYDFYSRRDVSGTSNLQDGVSLFPKDDRTGPLGIFFLTLYHTCR